nr:DUF1800 family protein [Spirosoma utsteinense]
MLRRATVGPTQREIAVFTGLSATQAVRQLSDSSESLLSPAVAIDSSLSTTVGQPFLTRPYSDTSNDLYLTSVKYWWLALMTTQKTPVNLLDKLTLFWQNHFVVTSDVVSDHRFINRYLLLLRNNALGSFETLLTEISKDPAMLCYLNGNENEKGRPNENYARELQEIYTVGVTDTDGTENYSEDDVKAAARVLTGWAYTNYETAGTTSIDPAFDISKHDATDKAFSSNYNNTVISSRPGTPNSFATTGEAELGALVTMLLKHASTPRFICRKLYRWYVNPTITPAIETDIIGPLATFFASPENNYAIRPVLEKLLTSQAFFSNDTIGTIIKSPIELVLGALRFFEQPVPDMVTDTNAFRNYFTYAYDAMRSMEFEVLNQPGEFGYEPYYQTGYSRTWLTSVTVAERNKFTDTLVERSVGVKPGFSLGIDLLSWVRTLQSNFDSMSVMPAITCEQVLASFTENLFAVNLSQSQRDFLIDTIMMKNAPRSSWITEWNAFRSASNDAGKRTLVMGRLESLMKYLLRMAEYQVY